MILFTGARYADTGAEIPVQFVRWFSYHDSENAAMVRAAWNVASLDAMADAASEDPYTIIMSRARFGILRHVMLINREIRWRIRADAKGRAPACGVDCRDCDRDFAERSRMFWDGRAK